MESQIAWRGSLRRGRLIWNLKTKKSKTKIVFQLRIFDWEVIITLPKIKPNRNRYGQSAKSPLASGRFTKRRKETICASRLLTQKICANNRRTDSRGGTRSRNRGRKNLESNFLSRRDTVLKASIQFYRRSARRSQRSECSR